jgi:hypothetical protein
VRRDLVAAVRFVVLPTVALVVVLSLAPGRAGVAARVYALLVSATVLLLALSALRRSYPPERPLRESRRGVSSGRRPPASLDRIERETQLGVAGSFDLHYRLVPRMRGLAAGLLASRRRIDLAAQPDAAQRALGDETWELVRPDREPPADRRGPGISPDELERVVDSLEAV